ncbi:MAG TPA: alpha-amylase family glycosyl hydrolase, partial [bacterium]|nr:alpha-amylase family glycosyl hydrolase [bacterium]
MYLIMVDRFNNGDNSNDQLNAGYEYDPTHRGKIHGGDIKGIINKIPYLKELGITAIWLTPVLKNKPTYHGYSIQNFKAIDQHFGTLEEYKELVRIAHQNGISVLMDVVVNHSADLIGNTQNNYSFNYPQGYTLKWHDNNLKHEPKYLANLNFFHNYGNIGWGWDDPIEGVVGDFYGLDDFKTENIEVQKILSYIYMWWILKTDIDGFRIDTAKHVDMSFWEYFLPYIKSEAAKINKTNFFMFGEIWSDYNDEMIGKYSGTKYNSSKYLFESLTYFTMKNTILEVFKYQGATNKI